MANNLGELLKKNKLTIEESLNDYDYKNKSYEELTGYLGSGELPMRDDDDITDNSNTRTGTLDRLINQDNQEFEQEDNQEFEQEDNQEFEQELEQEDNQELEQEDNQELEQEDNQEFEQEDNQEFEQEDNQEFEQEDNQEFEQEDNQEFEQEDNQEFEQEDNQEFEQEDNQNEPSDEPSVSRDGPSVVQDIYKSLYQLNPILFNVEKIREILTNTTVIQSKHESFDNTTVVVDFLNVENNERKVVFEHNLNKNIGDISVSDIVENNRKFLEHASLKDIVPKVTFKEDKQELMVTMRYENVKPQEISLKNVHTHNIIDLELIENDEEHKFDYIVRLSNDKFYGLNKDSLIQDGICQESNTHSSTTDDVVKQLDKSVLSDDNRDKLVERMRDFLNHLSSPDRLLPNSTQIGDYFDDNLTHILPDDKSNIDDAFVQEVLDKLSKAKLDETDNTTFLEDVYDVAFECINQLREHVGLSELESVDYHSLGITDEDTFKKDLIECLLLNSYSDTVEHVVESEIVDDADNEAGNDNKVAQRLDDYIDVYNVNGSSTSRANGGLTISEVIFDHLIELLENDTFKNVITKDDLSLIDAILLNDESEIVSGRGIYEQFDYNVRNTSVVFLFN